MSNLLRYDPLLVRALAAELGAALRGRAAAGQPVFARDLSCTLPLDRGQALRWDLHPRRGWVRLVDASTGGEGARPPDPSELSARVTRVSAPADERLLRIDLHEGTRFRGARRALVIELHTNQWNALLMDAETRRIVSVLRARAAGERALRAGAVYHPPPPTRRVLPGRPRAELAAEWTAALAAVPPAERPRALVRRFAYTSPMNAAWVLGEAAARDGDDALEDAFERWWEMADGDASTPVLLRTASGPQPYPLLLPGTESRPYPSLLAAMERAAAEEPAGDAAEADAAAAPGAELLERARRRLAGIERRLSRLMADMGKTGEADRLRGWGDLLLAHLDWAEAGQDSVVLPGFEGDEVTVPLDPALRPHENAERLYEQARRRTRADARLPELVAEAERERERWAGVIASLEAGEVPEGVKSALRRPESASAAAAADDERLPYRPYRTSGGIEVRVGRSSRDNDRLTFGHAAPGDVWLHARSVPGSHVVLRWREPGAPPARDLEEAAVLAAWFSKARSSGTVAVDWTRRRYVRKPRGAPPGRVSLVQAKTLFVEPDSALEERLRVQD
ncbi:MAG TPA: NFACT RNA binding domain-containing protein [Longimicrobium sp.]|uniref:NFACT RNA binding domain-containing protein n=1 Tax=Longimicrobium sp. TaxID=2029185 RepID=UPI002ED80EC7